MTYLRILLLLLLVITNTLCAKRVSIINHRDISVGTKFDGTEYSLDEIAKAIYSGCIAKKWIPKRIGPNDIQASIMVRGKHSITVSIPFSEESFSILFFSAENMDYKERSQKIHPNYNRWTSLLIQSILQEIRTPQ